MIKYENIDHVTVNISNLEASRHFYAHILGLKEIKRPDFLFEGAWFLIGDTYQTLHLVKHNGQTVRDNGGFEILDGHFALKIQNFEETIDWLNECNTFYTVFPSPQAGYSQIFVLDPDNNIIELNTNLS